MARKKIQIDNSVSAAVPLSAMIDVVFLLLIYFIMTQKPVVEDIYLQLNLPSPNPAPSASDSEPPPILRIDVMKLQVDNDDEIARLMRTAKTQIEVNAIRKREKVYYHVNTTGDGGGTPMIYADLEKYLKSVAEAAPDTTIVMNCGPNAKHKKLVRVLDLCDKLGLKNINLLNDATVEFNPDPPEKRKK